MIQNQRNRNIHSRSNVVFRPNWTSGRYSSRNGKRIAIYYNLLTGISYLFEDDSASVVNCLLKIPRNECISIVEIASSIEDLNTDVTIDDIQDFIEDLMNLGLVTNHLPSEEELREYRKQQQEFNVTNGTIEIPTEEKLPMENSTTETEYMKAVGGVFSVMFELTYRCSEKCIHCYNIGATRNDNEVSHRGDLDELTFDDYKRIINELYEQGLVKVCLSGGDPFSKSFVWELIDYIYNKGLVLDIYTNGQQLLGKEQRLANYFPHQVGVSIYSGDAATHDSITRVKGSWDKSIKVLDELSRFAIPLTLKCSVMRPNVSNYYTVSDLGRKYGARVQYEVNVTDSIEGDKCVSQFLRLTPEQLEIVLRDDNTPMYVGKEAPNYGGQPKNMKANACGSGENTFCVTPDGQLIPCCAFHLSFGSLKEQSVATILAESKNYQYWNNLILEQYEECGKYAYCDYCNLCAGNNYSEHNDATKAAENNCYMAKCRYELAQKMMNGFDPLEGKTLQEKLKDFTARPQKGIKRVITNK